jgi:hypothetical protein
MSKKVRLEVWLDPTLDHKFRDLSHNNTVRQPVGC